jgi:hypothetical protein
MSGLGADMCYYGQQDHGHSYSTLLTLNSRENKLLGQ